jgi:hypothetical protein
MIKSRIRIFRKLNFREHIKSDADEKNFTKLLKV